MIWIILILATTLRLVKIDQSFWLDEAINIVASQNYSFWDMVTKYPVGDFHPPGYFALLWIWARIGGIGEIWVRLPSLILGVTTVWLVFLLGKELFNRKTGLFAALFMALAPLHVYYSQEARMYSFAAFSVALSFYFFWKVLNKGNMVNLVGYGISNAFVLYSDYLAYLIFPTQFIYFLLFKRNFLVKVISVWILNLVILIPWLAVFSKQLAAGTAAASLVPGWASVVGGASVKELLLIPVKIFFGRVSIDDKQIYGLLSSLVGIVYGGLIVIGVRKLNSGTKLLMFWLFIPVILAFAISFFIPVLTYFRMLFILPAVYLLLAKGLDVLSQRAMPIRRRLLWLVTGTVCTVSAISLWVYYTNPKFQREDWRGAVYAVDQLAQGNGIILFENNDLPAPFIYYSKNLSPAIGGLKKIPVQEGHDLNEIPRAENIYLFEYLVDITDPKKLLEKEIDKKGFQRVETLNFSGVGFVHHFVKAKKGQDFFYKYLVK